MSGSAPSDTAGVAMGMRCDVDLHTAIGPLAGGCPPTTDMNIL
jgi:hypothetical protein